MLFLGNRKRGIVNVKMIITEEKILSNIDKVEKLINPNSKKQIIQLEDDAYFKDAYADALKKVAESDWLTDAKFNEYYETAKQNYESVVVPSIEFANADNDMFKFSLEGKFTSGDDANMSFSEYAKRILEAYKEG